MPVEITVGLIKQAMQKNGWAKKKFLIDGFPRNEDNFSGWNKIMGDLVDMKFVLFLDCDEDVMIERVQKRGAAQGDQKRNDDNLEVLKKRFNTFREQSMPIVDLFAAEGKVRKIDAG